VGEESRDVNVRVLRTQQENCGPKVLWKGGTTDIEFGKGQRGCGGREEKSMGGR